MHLLDVENLLDDAANIDVSLCDEEILHDPKIISFFNCSIIFLLKQII